MTAFSFSFTGIYQAVLKTGIGIIVNPLLNETAYSFRRYGDI